MRPSRNQIINTEKDVDIYIEKGARLSDLPWEAQRVLLERWSEVSDNYELMPEEFLRGMLTEAITDAAIGNAKQWERKALNQIGGYKHTQNVSTMFNRGQKSIEAFFRAQGV